MNVNPPDVATDPAAPPKRKRKPRAPKPPGFVGDDSEEGRALKAHMDEIRL